jgi:hypothetical protein
VARKHSIDVNELCDSPTVVALDPGGTTGWCVFQCHPESLIDPEVLVLDNIDYWQSGQFTGSEDQQAADIFNLICSWAGCAVLIEDFVLRMMSPDRDLLSPVRITAKVEHLLWQRELTFFKQMPSEAKTTATDDRLKSWKLYKPGEEHGRDATRHAITFMRKARSRWMLRMYAWPHLYGIGAEYGPTEEELIADSNRIKNERAEASALKAASAEFNASKLARIG